MQNVQNFLQRFQEKYAVCNCKGLLKHDISKPEEVLAKAKELNIDGITTCGMDTGIRALAESAMNWACGAFPRKQPVLCPINI